MNLIERTREYAAIGTRRYLASVVNRTIGREAWNHALQNPTEDDLNIKVSLLNLNYYPIDPERPKHKKKSRGLITLFDKYNHRAAVFGVWQAIAPSTFRFFEPVLYNGSSVEDRLKNDKKAAYFESAKLLAAIATDTAILGAATWLSQDSNNNLPAHSFVAWKLAGNAAFHTSLDLIDATFEGTGRLSHRVNTATQTSIEQLSVAAESMASRLDNSPTLQKGTELVLTTAEKIRSFISPRIQQP